MNRLLLFFSIITALTLVSCGKTERVLSEEKSEPVELSQDYADLQNALLELNKKYSVSIPETRPFFR